MDSFLSPRLFHDYDTHEINSSSTKQSNRKDMPPYFGTKKLKFERDDKGKGCLYALVWKGR